MRELEVKKAFEVLYDRQPDLIVRSPARVNLIGEHTDYNQGFVLPAAIDKEIHFAVALNQSDKVNFHSLEYNEQATIDLNAVAPMDTTWPNYLAGMVDQLQKAGYKLGGFDCVFGGNIPVGAGLSSSAAITSGIGFAFNELFKLSVEPIELARFAQQAEHTFVGVQCGIMDQFANLMGRMDHAIKLDCLSMEYEYIPLNFEEYEIILCNSKVRHSLASSAYNTRRDECNTGLSIIKKKFVQVKSMQDVTIEMLEEMSDQMDEAVYRRIKYVIEENERVHASCQLLKNQNVVGFGKCLYQSHEGLSNLYEVSCHELDFLVEHASSLPYVAGARMIGGGFGGCTINIVRKGNETLFKNEISEAYNKEFGMSPEVFKVHFSEGTSLVCQ